MIFLIVILFASQLTDENTHDTSSDQYVAPLVLDVYQGKYTLLEDYVATHSVKLYESLKKQDSIGIFSKYKTIQLRGNDVFSMTYPENTHPYGVSARG